MNRPEKRAIRRTMAQNERTLRRRRARIEELLAKGEIAGAAELAEAALADGHEDPMFLNLAAWRREESGDFSGAHRFLRRAQILAPGDVMILASIGAVFRKEGRLEEALAILDRVVAAEPRHSSAWLERGYTLDALHSNDARESYRRAIALEPNLAPALGKLADDAARRGDVAGARDFAGRALAINPLEAAATCAAATLEIEARNGASAEALVRPLLQASVAREDRTRALTLLGDALDRQGKTAEAFAAYRAAQANFREMYAPSLAPSLDRPSHRSFIETIATQVEATGGGRRYDPSPLPNAARRHVFLIGYPRSGTTLVENVLASAPNVVALEERDTLGDSNAALIANDGSMPDLDALDAQLVQTLRNSYWHRVGEMAGDVRDAVFVDMNPLNGAKLPVIARLFPDARIVVMRRDPRDVVLSCFRINFTPSPMAWSFSELEEAAKHYSATMHLTELCRAVLPLAFHVLRYDRLVTAFEPTTRELADFVGLSWTDAFLEFDKTAQRRGVRTASAAQVRRGLYDGRAQWRRYERELAPALPILAPWIERFGFEA